MMRPIRGSGLLPCMAILLVFLSSPWTLCAAKQQQQPTAYIVPLEMRQGAVRSRAWSSSGSSSGRNLLGAGKVQVMGSVREGYFYATLPLGSPAQTYGLIVDTGSTITYVPCSDCAHCGPNHYNPPYNPSQSSTAHWIGCDEPACKRQPSMMFCDTSGSSSKSSSKSSSAVTHAVSKALDKKYGGGSSSTSSSRGGSSSSSSSGQCTYEIFYAEQSTSKGRLVRDVFTFPDNVTAVPVTLGCESGETGEIYRQKADGILGMGNNPGTFHGELAASGAIPHMFSLCFGFPSGGALLLGDPQIALPPAPSHPTIASPHTTPAASPQAPQFSWVALVPNSHSDYYRVKLASISLGGRKLPVDASVFDQGHGTILDSGTTYLAVPTPVRLAWIAAARAAAKARGLREFTDRYNDICFTGGGLKPDFANLSEYFPEVRMDFEGGGLLKLPPYRYMFQYGSRGSYCLGVIDSQWGGLLIGGVATRNVLVKYDLENKRIGFADADCHSMGQLPANQFHLPLGVHNTTTAAAVKQSAHKAAAAAAAAAAGSDPLVHVPRTTGQAPPAAAAAAVDKVVEIKDAVEDTAAAAAATAQSLFDKIAKKYHKATSAADAAVAAAEKVLRDEEEEEGEEQLQEQDSEEGEEGQGEGQGESEEAGEDDSSEEEQQQQQQEGKGKGEEEEAAPAALKDAAAAAASNSSSTAAAAPAAAARNTSSSANSSSSGNATAAAAAAATQPPAPLTDTAAAPPPPVHWGGGSGVLKPSDDEEASWIEMGLVALTGLAFIGIAAGFIWRYWAPIKAAAVGWLFKHGTLQRAGFRQVATSDAGEGFGGSYPGADLAGVALLPHSSRGAGSSSGGGQAGRGKYAGGQIALTATAARNAAAAAAGGGTSSSAAAAAAAVANGGFPQLVVHNASDDADSAAAGAGGAGGLLALGGEVDAVKSPPGGRDQTSPPYGNSSAAAAAGGAGGSQQQQQLARLPPPLLQGQQQQQQAPQFVAHFSLDLDDQPSSPQAIGAASSAAAGAAEAAGAGGLSEQQQQQRRPGSSSGRSDAPMGSDLSTFQSISLDEWGEAPSKQG